MSKLKMFWGFLYGEPIETEEQLVEALRVQEAIIKDMRKMHEHDLAVLTGQEEPANE